MYHKNKGYTKQQGFSLVELIIALALGLIIMAAVMQVFIIGARTASIQQSASGVIDANVFGLQQIEKKLRLAGLGLAEISASRKDGSGILIYTPIVGGGGNAGDVLTSFNLDLFHSHATRDGSEGPERTYPSNTTQNSDQITIQYRAPVDMKDCEGNLILGPRDVKTTESVDDTDLKRVDGQIVVERYFLLRNRTDGTLNLLCDAGKYIKEDIIEDAHPKIASGEATKLTGANNKNKLESGIMARNGAIIISNVDDFQVLLGVVQGDTIRYVSAKEYYDGNEYRTKPIVSVKLAILARGDIGVAQADIPDDLSFDIFGETVTLKDGVPANYVRRVYESTVMLRNSRGAV